MEPNFSLTTADRVMVNRIVVRASQMWEELDTISLAMDITAVHNHACRLRLRELLQADDFNFAHDIVGIMNNLDRENLTMNCFWPRFAAKQ